MNNDNFAVFILTHGRPNNVKTFTTLKKCGYEGDVYFIVDNEDKTINQYQKNYGIEFVKIFDKKAMADSIDEGNNFDDRAAPVHARNACFQIAKELNKTYFILLEDDYTSFEFRYPNKKKTKLLVAKSENINTVFNLFLEFYKSTNITSVAFAQGGDFIGGLNGSYNKVKRKAMNSFFCSTERPFKFVGVLNDDVNTYVTLGNVGHIFLTVPLFSLVQAPTQAQKSGMTDQYLKFGTYCKSFTSLMMHPSGVKVSIMHTNHSRIHHSIIWKNTTPMIIQDKYKKL
jgi:hypothetical protein